VNYLWVILAALLLALIGATATAIVARCRPPRCPTCGWKEIVESAEGYFCERCGRFWRDQEPKRFGRHGGMDI
jgi:tRNA(Ile2) C34 agmatinyltransferase TiaS